MMNLGLMDPAFLGGLTSYDPDAAVYIAAVESADGQVLETGVKTAIDSFVRGCKTDGTWNAIKSSCILAGARTLTGALVPLVGTAPTNINNNFVSGDYNRKTGLKGSSTAGSGAKRLNTNRLANADGLNDYHLSVHQTLVDSGNGYPMLIGGEYATYGIGTRSADTKEFFFRPRTTVTNNIGSTVTGFVGMSRVTSSSYTARSNGSSQTINNATTSTPAVNVHVFCDSNNTMNYNGRLFFYSIGASLNLASLDARVTALVNALAVAIP